jgi:hypothetical protein
MGMSEMRLPEQVEAFAGRLERIGVVAPELRALAAEVSHGRIPSGLIARLEEVDRDLLLAGHELDLVLERAMLERASLSGADERARPDASA